MSTRGVQFDDWQFQGRYQTRAVSVQTKLSFDDYSRSMQTQHRAQRRMWTPPFALDDRLLRRVLLARAWRYRHHGTPLPANADWQQVNRDATAKALEPHQIKATSPLIQKQMYTMHVRAVIKAGSYLALQSSIAYKRWRLGEDSVQIAEELGISPNAVRIGLARLRDIAKKLGFDIGQEHHSRGSAEHSRRLKKAWRRRKRQDAQYQEPRSDAS
jgi:DNA-binding CsgD family transcriptional regulator